MFSFWYESPDRRQPLEQGLLDTLSTAMPSAIRMRAIVHHVNQFLDIFLVARLKRFAHLAFENSDCTHCRVLRRSGVLASLLID